MLQVFGRDGKRDRVANSFVEAVVGAIAEERRLLIVGTLIKIVAEFVMNHGEVLVLLLDAHLDAQVLDVVNVPSACDGRPLRGRAAW